MQEDLKNTIDQLTSEYKIAQDKIDKIAAFRFTIRGWTVTLLTGAIVALASARIVDHILVALVLSLITLLVLEFGALEERQNRVQEIFKDRAYTIEVEIRHLLRRMRRSPYPAVSVIGPRIALLLKEHSASREQRWRRLIDHYFYRIQATLAVIGILAVLYLRPKHEKAASPPPSIRQIILQGPLPIEQLRSRKGSNSSERQTNFEKNQKASR